MAGCPSSHQPYRIRKRDAGIWRTSVNYIISWWGHHDRVMQLNRLSLMVVNLLFSTTLVLQIVYILFFMPILECRWIVMHRVRIVKKRTLRVSCTTGTKGIGGWGLGSQWNDWGWVKPPSPVNSNPGYTIAPANTIQPCNPSIRFTPTLSLNVRQTSTLCTMQQGWRLEYAMCSRSSIEKYWRPLGI